MNEWPVYRRGKRKDNKQTDSQNVYDSLPEPDKVILEDYIKYRGQTCLVQRNLENYKREVIRFRQIINKPLDQITLTDLQLFNTLVNKNVKSGATERTIKHCIQNFLEWKYLDYSLRFNNFRDLRQVHKELLTRGKTTHKDYSHTVTPEELKKIVDFENDLFWKAFILLQAETGMRTTEVRCLKWNDVILKDGDISEIKIFSTKNEKTRYVFFKEAYSYLKLLKENSKSVYVFPSPMNPKNVISRTSIASKFRYLAKKVLGDDRQIWSYLLRHTKATALYEKVERGELDEGLATRLLGHGKSMREVYSQIPTEKRKEIMKQKLFGANQLTPEQENELKIRIKELELKDNESERRIKEMEVKLTKAGEGLSGLETNIIGILQAMGHKVQFVDGKYILVKKE